MELNEICRIVGEVEQQIALALRRLDAVKGLHVVGVDVLPPADVGEVNVILDVRVCPACAASDAPVRAHKLPPRGGVH